MKIFVDIPENNKEAVHVHGWFKKHGKCNIAIAENVGSVVIKCHDHRLTLNLSIKEINRMGIKFLRQKERPVDNAKGTVDNNSVASSGEAQSMPVEPATNDAKS